MIKYSLLSLLLLSTCVSCAPAGGYTNPARIEEMRKKTKPADEEKSGDKNKAEDKKQRYEQSQRTIKHVDEKQEEIGKIEDAVYFSD